MAENSTRGGLITLRSVVKTYQTPSGPYRALGPVDLDIGQGELTAVVGKSGSGKSTLINILTGIDLPTSGEIHVGGTRVDLLKEARLAVWRGTNVGVVFQFFQLLPTLTALENVVLPMDLCGTSSPPQRRKRAMELLERVGIPEQAGKFPLTLSGGQQQRVAIARALANDPMLLVADEPTGNLDQRTGEEVWRLFGDLVTTG